MSIKYMSTEYQTAYQLGSPSTPRHQSDMRHSCFKARDATFSSVQHNCDDSPLYYCTRVSSNNEAFGDRAKICRM